MTLSPAPTDVGGLKALALAATPGPWSTVVRMGGDAIVDARIRPVARVDYRRDELGRDADAAFIAAANPAAILSLIALLETQASALAEKDAALKDAGEALGPFARHAVPYEHRKPGCTIGGIAAGHGVSSRLTVAHLRKARSVLSTISGAGK